MVNKANELNNGEGIQAWTIVISMSIASFTLSLSSTSIVTAMLVMAKQLNITPSGLLWLINSYFLATLSCVLPAGKLANTFGSKKIYLSGSLIFIIGSLIIALIPIAKWVIIGRALQGIGGSGLVVTSLSIAKAQFSKSRQHIASSFWATGMGFAFAFGPLIAGLLTDTIGWEYIFWLLILLLILSYILLILAKFKNIKHEIRQPFDFIGFSLFFLALVPLILSLSSGNKWGWTNGWIMGELIFSFFLFITLAIFEWFKKHPLINLHFLKIPYFKFSVIGFFLMTFCRMSVLYFLNIYMQDPLLLNYSPHIAGLALLSFGIPFFVSSYLVSILLSHFSRKWLLFTASTLSTVGFFCLCFINPHTSYQFLWAPYSLIGLGLGFSLGAIPGIGLGSLKHEEAHDGSSLITLSMYFGTLLSVSIGTIFLFKVRLFSAFDKLKAIPLSQADQSLILKDISGNTMGISDLLKSLPSNISTLVNTAVEQANINGIVSIMMICAAACLLQSILNLYILRK